MGDLKKLEDGDVCVLWKLSCEGSKVLDWENDIGFTGGVLPSIELPKKDDGGGPAGVNDADEEGGGPAGVVEGFVVPNLNGPFPLLALFSGVDGGLEEKGT